MSGTVPNQLWHQIDTTTGSITENLKTCFITKKQHKMVDNGLVSLSVVTVVSFHILLSVVYSFEAKL